MALLVKESSCNTVDLGSVPGSGKIPGEGNGNPLQYSCLGNPMDKRVWKAIVHGVSRVRHNSEGKASTCNMEAQVRSLGFEDPLEKEIATHSSILAWKIPWTEEPGELQSMGCKELDTTEAT